jgi:uncharacterized protein YjbJ (UPF0337 family)
MANKDIDKAKGKVKQAAGDLTGDEGLRREGKADEAAGKAKGAVDKVTEKAKNLLGKRKDR